MAKPIPKRVPVKKATVRKKRRGEISDLMSPKAQKKADLKVKRHMMDMDEKAETRWNYVETIVACNDETFTEALDTMVESLKAMQGPPRLVIDGVQINVSESEFHMLQEIQERNFYWIALRCLVACAEWGIRIANFKAPTNACLRCGTKVTRAVKKH